MFENVLGKTNKFEEKEDSYKNNGQKLYVIKILIPISQDTYHLFYVSDKGLFVNKIKDAITFDDYNDAFEFGKEISNDYKTIAKTWAPFYVMEKIQRYERNEEDAQ